MVNDYKSPFTLPSMPDFPTLYTEKDAQRLQDLNTLAAQQQQIYKGSYTPEQWANKPFIQQQAQEIASGIYDIPIIGQFLPGANLGLTPEQLDINIQQTEGEIQELLRKQRVVERMPTIRDYIAAYAIQGLLSGEEARLYELIPELDPSSTSINRLDLSDEEREWILAYNEALSGGTMEDIMKLYDGFPPSVSFDQMVADLTTSNPAIDPAYIMSVAALMRDNDAIREVLRAAYPPQVADEEAGFSNTIWESVQTELKTTYGVDSTGTLEGDLRKLQELGGDPNLASRTVALTTQTGESYKMVEKMDGFYDDTGTVKIANKDAEGNWVNLQDWELFELDYYQDPDDIYKRLDALVVLAGMDLTGITTNDIEAATGLGKQSKLERDVQEAGVYEILENNSAAQSLYDLFKGKNPSVSEVQVRSWMDANLTAEQKDIDWYFFSVAAQKHNISAMMSAFFGKDAASLEEALQNAGERPENEALATLGEAGASIAVGAANFLNMLGSAHAWITGGGKTEDAVVLPHSGVSLDRLEPNALQRASQQIIEGIPTFYWEAKEEFEGKSWWDKLTDPSWYIINIGEQLPMTLMLMVPGGVGMAVGGRVATAAATRLGASVFQTAVARYAIGGTLASALSRPVESAFEAGDAYNTALSRGLSIEEAKAAGNHVFANNMKLSISDAVQFALIFAPTPKFLKTSMIRSGLVKTKLLGGKLVASGLLEGGEEYYQQGLQRQAMGDTEVWNWDAEMQECFAIGAMMGVGMGLGGDVLAPVIDRISKHVPPTIQDKFDTAKEKGGLSGALDTLTTEEAGKKAIELATAAAAEELINKNITNAERKVYANQLAYLDGVITSYDEALTDLSTTIQGLQQRVAEANLTEVEQAAIEAEITKLSNQFQDLHSKRSSATKERDTLRKTDIAAQPGTDIANAWNNMTMTQKLEIKNKTGVVFADIYNTKTKNVRTWDELSVESQNQLKQEWETRIAKTPATVAEASGLASSTSVIVPQAKKATKPTAEAENPIDADIDAVQEHFHKSTQLKGKERAAVSRQLNSIRRRLQRNPTKADLADAVKTVGQLKEYVGQQIPTKYGIGTIESINANSVRVRYADGTVRTMDAWRTNLGFAEELNTDALDYLEARAKDELAALKQELNFTGGKISERIIETVEQAKKVFEDMVAKTGRSIGKRIEASSGAAKLYPTYMKYREDIKKLGFEAEEMKRMGLPTTSIEFLADRERLILKYVEVPVQPLVRKLLVEGNEPYSSNAFGEGEKGVWYETPSGEKKFEALTYKKKTNTESKESLELAQTSFLELINESTEIATIMPMEDWAAVEKYLEGKGLTEESKHSLKNFLDVVGYHHFKKVIIREWKATKSPTGAQANYEVETVKDEDGGLYDQAVVNLFQSALNKAQVDVPIIHELWHHLERFLPKELVMEVQLAWKKSVEEYTAAHPWFVEITGKNLLESLKIQNELSTKEYDAILKRYPDSATDIANGFKLEDGKHRLIPKGIYYLFSPAEWMAVRCTERTEAMNELSRTKGIESIASYIRDYLKALVMGLKSLKSLKFTQEIKNLLGEDLEGRILAKFAMGNLNDLVNVRGVQVKYDYALESSINKPAASVQARTIPKNLPEHEIDPAMLQRNDKREAAREMAEVWAADNSNPLDIAMVAMYTTGDFTSFIDSIPSKISLGDKWSQLTETTKSYILSKHKLKFKEGEEILASDLVRMNWRDIPEKVQKQLKRIRFVNFVSDEFLNFKFDDVNGTSLAWQPVLDAMCQIGQGRFDNPLRMKVGLVADHAINAKMVYEADWIKKRINWSKKHKLNQPNRYLNPKARDVYDNKVATVMENVGFEDQLTPVAELIKKEPIKAALKGMPTAEKLSIVEYCLELRRNLDDLHSQWNMMREKMGLEPIPYIKNYLPEIMKVNMLHKVFGVNVRPSHLSEPTVVPDFMKPDTPFNARALERRGGLAGYTKIRDVGRLFDDYVQAVSRDLFYTPVAMNARAHAEVLRSQGLDAPAQWLDNWVSRSILGMPDGLTRFRLENADFRILGIRPWSVATFMRGRLNSAVFGLNPAWNLWVQTSSLALSSLYNGNYATAVGFARYIFSKSERQWIRDNCMSMAIKSKAAGSMAYQDLSTSVVAGEVARRSPLQTVDEVCQLFTTFMENLLTGGSCSAAKYKGQKMGITSTTKLAAFASDGGAKTQSMYDTIHRPTVLSPGVAFLVPFQTFSFEALTRIREMTNINIHGKHPFGQAGAYRTVAQTSAEGEVVTRIRLQRVIEFIGAVIVCNLLGAHFNRRKPWEVTSFVPFFNTFYFGVDPTRMRMPVYGRYISEMWEGFDKAISDGDMEDLILWMTKWHTPAGYQSAKTYKGAKALIEGEYEVSDGETFDVEASDWLNALVFGVWGTEQGEEWLRHYIDNLPMSTKEIKRKLEEKEASLGQSVDGQWYTLKDYRSEALRMFENEGIPSWMVSEDVPIYSDLTIFAVDCDLLWEEYKSLNTAEERTAYRIANPYVDATLLFWEQVQTAKTTQANEYLVTLWRTFGVDQNPRMTWRGFPEIPDYIKLMPE